VPQSAPFWQDRLPVVWDDGLDMSRSNQDKKWNMKGLLELPICFSQGDCIAVEY
jgi:hypothetical protein